MPLLYKKIRRVVPNNPKASKFYLILKSIGRMGEREVACEIADETTLNPKEAEMAIYQFQKVLTKALLNGKTVQLGELGTFQLTVRSKGVDEETELNANLIEKVNLQFTPSTTLRQNLQKATFMAAEKLLSKSSRDNYSE